MENNLLEYLGGVRSSASEDSHDSSSRGEASLSETAPEDAEQAVRIARRNRELMHAAAWWGTNVVEEILDDLSEDERAHK